MKALGEAARITNNYLDGVEALGVVKVLGELYFIFYISICLKCCLLVLININGLGPRLVEMRQHNMAAQLYMGADMIKEALDTLIANEDWQRAMKIVKEIEPR